MAAERAAMLAAAVKAAVQAKAPIAYGRTVAAVAAAVVTALTQPTTTAAQDAAVPGTRAGTQETFQGNCEELVQRLREARAAKRRAKRQKRQAEKAAEALTLAEQKPQPSACQEVLHQSKAAVVKRRAEAGNAAVTSPMEVDTAQTRRRLVPQVCPEVVAQLQQRGILQQSTTPSTSAVSVTPEAEGGQPKRDRGKQQPARRGPC